MGEGVADGWEDTRRTTQTATQPAAYMQGVSAHTHAHAHMHVRVRAARQHKARYPHRHTHQFLWEGGSGGHRPLQSQTAERYSYIIHSRILLDETALGPAKLAGHLGRLVSCGTTLFHEPDARHHFGYRRDGHSFICDKAFRVRPGPSRPGPALAPRRRYHEMR